MVVGRSWDLTNMELLVVGDVVEAALLTERCSRCRAWRHLYRLPGPGNLILASLDQ